MRVVAASLTLRVAISINTNAKLMLPLLLAMDATKKGLLSFVQQMGMVVLSELLVNEAAQIAGPKGKHVEGRTHHHWGTGTTPVGFGGRHVSLPHPRVRERGKGQGKEVTLPARVDPHRPEASLARRAATSGAMRRYASGRAVGMRPRKWMTRDAQEPVYSEGHGAMSVTGCTTTARVARTIQKPGRPLALPRANSGVTETRSRDPVRA
jgi:hypothetical protein